MNQYAGGAIEMNYLVTESYQMPVMFKRMGPGVLIAAAFIGPGTVTACSLAGVRFGYGLLWAMLFSVVATIVLQEMAVRVGIVTQKGLATVVSTVLTKKWMRLMVLTLILLAVLVGNSAYEGGNIGGAVLGLEALIGSGTSNYSAPFVTIFAFLLLWFGNYKLLERVFMVFIVLMSLAFITVAVLTMPSLTQILNGLFVPHIPEDGLLTVIALIGTTVVPYNLFLHASLVNEKWKGAANLNRARWDTVLAVGLGGIVSSCIIVAAASSSVTKINNALDMAEGLTPLFGTLAHVVIGIGLFAAGITSSITAPLAAAFVARNCFGWSHNFNDLRFRAVWIMVLVFGFITIQFGISPIEVIQFAQVANGLLLPIIAVVLLWMVNHRVVMGSYKNNWVQNIIALLIIVICLILGAKSIGKVFQLL